MDIEKNEFATKTDNEIKDIIRRLKKAITCSTISIRIAKKEDICDFQTDNKEYIKEYKNLFIIDNNQRELIEATINLSELSTITDNDFQIKFKGLIVDFNKNGLIGNNPDNNKIIIHQNLYFDHCDFKAIELKNICFEIFEINSCKYKSDQKKSIVFRACEFKELSLNNSIFLENIKFKEETKIKYLYANLSEFKKYFFIQNCTIENISLWKNKFENRCYFVDSKFGYKQDKDNKAELNFSNAHFQDNAYFNNSHFKDSADFHECEFEKTACFYGVKFDKIPNFSQVQFRGSLNAVNTNLVFDFESLENKIYKECKTRNHITSENKENLGYIKRFFKYLISFFTKASKDTKKYQKPIEHFANDFRDSFRILKNTLIKDNNLLDASNFHKYELYSKEVELKHKNNQTLKDKVEKWQLWFYRKLCDHHTDILKSFHSLMLVIGLFGLMSFGVIAGFDYCLGYKPILSHPHMIKKIYDAHIHFFIETHTLCTFLFNIFILGVYLLMLFISIKWKIPRRFLIGVSYAIVICILLVSPKILIPAMGIFTDKRALLDPLSTLGGIYTIVFGFVLFSFIKTIRKNSIVPS